MASSLPKECIAFLVAVLCSGQAAMGQAAAPSVLAEYPPGTFLENLLVSADGTVRFTDYLAKRIEIISPGSPARTFASLPVHPVSIVETGSGLLVAAHGEAFTSGSGFVKTQQFLVLDNMTGRIIKQFNAPEAFFLNGMVAKGDGRILVADSIAGTIWEVDPAAGTLLPWARHEMLTQDPAKKEFSPGANGIKRTNNGILVSNSSRGSLYRIDIGPDGKPSGAPELAHSVGGIDDFVVSGSGEIYFASHGATAGKIAVSGAVSTVLAEGCDGCTAVALRVDAAGGQRLVILTTGGFLEGLKRPAKVLEIPLPPN